MKTNTWLSQNGLKWTEWVLQKHSSIVYKGSSTHPWTWKYLTKDDTIFYTVTNHCVNFLTEMTPNLMVKFALMQNCLQSLGHLKTSVAHMRYQSNAKKKKKKKKKAKRVVFWIESDSWESQLGVKTCMFAWKRVLFEFYYGAFRGHSLTLKWPRGDS